VSECFSTLPCKLKLFKNPELIKESKLTKNLNSTSYLIVLLTSWLLIFSPVISADVEVVDESLGMKLERVAVPVRGGDLLDIDVVIFYRAKMRQADYPDFIELEKDIRKWVAGYQKSREQKGGYVYWEMLTKYLAESVLENYTTINRIDLEATVYPTAATSYTHFVNTTVMRHSNPEQGYTIVESISLPIERYGIEQQGPNVIDLLTTLTYKPGINSSEYPDFDPVYKDLFSMMENYPIETDYWETMIKAMSAELLAKYSAFSEVTMDMNVYPTASLTYPHRVKATTRR